MTKFISFTKTFTSSIVNTFDALTLSSSVVGVAKEISGTKVFAYANTFLLQTVYQCSTSLRRTLVQMNLMAASVLISQQQ